VLRASLQLPQRYFLACARFGRKKNILGLISSYSRFFERTSRDDVPHLIIVGDGEERVALEGLIKRNHLEKMVHLVGSKSYREMPAYYALAEVFIHASTTEQWGLVVNEAMASGLPVLVSNHCGCAADLVKEGENGFTFDPNDEQQIAGLMEKVSEDREGCGAMGVRSREIIANWSPSRFVEGLSAAVSVACFMKKHRASFLERLLLSAILLR
jgi:glycosyltransferase involved in cell wall biosynthesis